MLRDAAKVADTISSASGLQAGFDRRADGWKFQVDGAALELKQLERQIAIAQIRQDVAERSLAIHQKTVDQAQEVYDFYRSRFTNRVSTHGSSPASSGPIVTPTTLPTRWPS